VQAWVEYKGAIYHLTVRANGGDAFFEDDGDRRYLLSRIAEARATYQVRVLMMLDGPNKDREPRYRQFVETGLATDDEEFVAVRQPDCRWRAVAARMLCRYVL